MSKRRLSPLKIAALSAAFLPSLGGCGEANNPKIVEAPAYTPPPVEEPGKIAGRKEAYGANKRYQDAMERAANR